MWSAYHFWVRRQTVMALCRQFLVLILLLHTGIHRSTYMEEISSEREKEESPAGKTPFCCALGVCKRGSPLVGRKGTGLGSLFLWDHLICRVDNDESDTFEDGVGFDVPPAPYVTSQTQNIFCIHPFYLLSKCQHWFNSQFPNLGGKMSRSLPMPSVAE